MMLSMVSGHSRGIDARPNLLDLDDCFRGRAGGAGPYKGHSHPVLGSNPVFTGTIFSASLSQTLTESQLRAELPTRLRK